MLKDNYLTIYKGTVCRESATGEEECLYLEPGLTLIMANSRNASELLWAWEGWRANVARTIRPLYLQVTTKGKHGSIVLVV